jgi:hypothetical protein
MTLELGLGATIIGCSPGTRVGLATGRANQRAQLSSISVGGGVSMAQGIGGRARVCQASADVLDLPWSGSDREFHGSVCAYSTTLS